MPSLLNRVHQNLKAGYNKFALFEIGKTHLKREGVNDEGLPEETNSLGFVVTAHEKAVSEKDGAAFYQAKVYLEEIARSFGLWLDYQPLVDEDYEMVKPYQPGRSALLVDRNTGNYIGIVGEYRSSVRRAFKLPIATAGFELLLAPLLELPPKRNYQPLPKFPGTSQDICFKVPRDMTFSQLETTLGTQIRDSLKNRGYQCGVSAIDIFHKDKARSNNITFRISLHHPDRTLTTDEVTDFVEQIAASVCKQLGITKV